MKRMINSIFYPRKIRRPSLFWLVTESGRAMTEYSVSLPYRKLLKHAKKGDGHPVLVIPGFMTTDLSTAPMRTFLSQLGYLPYGWEQGRNYAAIELIDVLAQRLEEIYQEHGQRVSLIGWSMGGIYARQIAKRNPEYVRQIITMGSPFAGITEPNNVSWIYNLFTWSKVEEVDPWLIGDLPKAAPVPTTAIYSKQDGIVPWQVCLETEEDDWHQNVQVRGSHLGLGVNPAVLAILADRVQYKQSNWKAFKAGFLKKLLFYPSH
jgi:hypothetical protein